ncbi:hypothetical protein NI389_05940 [Pseudoalteromonas xiamenensis]|uniref:hypothetical protein n=1 Tax=Pseudoalteromonas xiamenensis TaxID=882626 RepID=UPI0027E4914C|nr:hypothetical protein [Pseudoalteromonas xiamenensis]WMN60937.1 hypothetical protein NI389_05940 [Pseudoalteromonas xiamenensis]
MSMLLRLLIALALPMHCYAQQSIAVIVNKANPVIHVSQRALIDLYMGKYQAFDNGMPAQPIDIESKMPLKETFYMRLTGRDLSQINAYRSRIKFSGKASFPIAMPNSDAIIKAVQKDPLAIGYIWAEDVTDQVKVVFTLDK